MSVCVHKWMCTIVGCSWVETFRCCLLKAFLPVSHPHTYTQTHISLKKDIPEQSTLPEMLISVRKCCEEKGKILVIFLFSLTLNYNSVALPKPPAACLITFSEAAQWPKMWGDIRMQLCFISCHCLGFHLDSNSETCNGWKLWENTACLYVHNVLMYNPCMPV